MRIPIHTGQGFGGEGWRRRFKLETGRERKGKRREEKEEEGAGEKGKEVKGI